MSAEENFQMLPPPKRGESFGNLKVETVRKEKRGPGRPSKNLTQFAVKVPADAKAAFNAAYEAAKASRPGLTMGDYFAEVVGGAAQAKSGKKHTAPVHATRREDEVPHLEDVKAGRTARRIVYLRKDLADVYDRAATGAQTLGAIIERAAALASKCQAALDELEKLKAAKR